MKCDFSSGINENRKIHIYSTYRHTSHLSLVLSVPDLGFSNQWRFK